MNLVSHAGGTMKDSTTQDIIEQLEQAPSLDSMNIIVTNSVRRAIPINLEISLNTESTSKEELEKIISLGLKALTSHKS